jgi:hypothetical protein
MIAQIQKGILIFAGLLLLAVPLAMVPQQPVYAAPVCGNNPGDPCEDPPQQTIRLCSDSQDACTKFINRYINPFINLLTVLVGIIAAISLVVAGIQYGSSADDPSAVSKAKSRIFNTLIGLAAYALLFAFLQWIIPGGVL